MKMQCCSKEKIRFEINQYLEGLKKSEEIKVIITKCPILKGTYDLDISLSKKEDDLYNS